MLAVDVPVPTNGSAAVQVALITALAPILVVIVNEVVRRLRPEEEDEDHDSLLAPTTEVPRAQYEELLSRIARMDELMLQRDRQYQKELESATVRLERAEANLARAQSDADDEIGRVRARHAEDVASLRARFEAELERRIRAETLLAALQQQRGGGER